MEEKITSLRKTARLAGFLYILLVMGAYGLMYVPSQIMVHGNTVATVNNLIGKEFLFRTGIVSNLLSSIVFVYLAMVLYRLFNQVNEHRAKLLVAFVIMQIPISFLLEAFNITALMIAKGELLKSIDSMQRQDFTLLFLKTHNYGIRILELFWGLWLFPFGQLIYKSGFIPSILGVILIISGIAYLVDSLTYLLFPDYAGVLNVYIFPFFSGELAIVLWLLIKGVKNNKNQVSKISTG